MTGHKYWSFLKEKTIRDTKYIKGKLRCLDGQFSKLWDYEDRSTVLFG